jgi:hypothetical protein
MDPRIDQHTITTADGGRLDLGRAVEAWISSLRPDLN